MDKGNRTIEEALRKHIGNATQVTLFTKSGVEFSRATIKGVDGGVVIFTQEEHTTRYEVGQICGIRCPS